MEITNEKVFAKNITKEEFFSLPLKSFCGEVIVIDSFAKFDTILPELTNASVLGFDTETRPTFRKGNRNKVALLQLSTSSTAWLFRLNKIGLPAQIAEILENKNILKVGVAIRDDIKALQSLRSFKPNSFIELQDYVKKFNIESNGLKEISAIVLDFRISKNQRLTNWEDDFLTESQLRYAATDAWVGYEIYKKLSTV